MTSFNALARLVSGYEKDGLPVSVKGKGHAPHAVSRFKAQFFHISVFGILQCVHMRPPNPGAEKFE